MVQSIERDNGIVQDNQDDQTTADGLEGQELSIDIGGIGEEGSTESEDPNQQGKAPKVKLSQKIAEDQSPEGEVFLRALYRFHRKSGIENSAFFEAVQSYLNAASKGGETFPDSFFKFYKLTGLGLDDFSGRILLYEAAVSTGNLPFATQSSRSTKVDVESLSPDDLIGALEKMKQNISQGHKERLLSLANMLS